MAGRLNWTIRRERGRESKRRAADQERWPRPRGQETGIVKMAELLRGQTGREGKWKGGRGFG